MRLSRSSGRAGERASAFPATSATRRSARARRSGGAGARRPRHSGQQRGPPAGPPIDPRHLDRGIRLDDEDQHLCAVLDHQGGAAAPETGLLDHRHDIRAGLRSVARPLRLRADQGGDDELCEVARQATGRKGIRVNGVAPGPIWTPLQVSGGATEEKVEHFGAQTPLGRPGQPAELASIYVQLAWNDASYSSGQIFGAEGGRAPV